MYYAIDPADDRIEIPIIPHITQTKGRCDTS